MPQAPFDYFAGLEWIGAKENCLLIGPAGTGKWHLLLALGHAAVDAGHRVRYFAATDLVETLYRGLADNYVGRLIDNLLRADLILLDELWFVSQWMHNRVLTANGPVIRLVDIPADGN